MPLADRHPHALLTRWIGSVCSHRLDQGSATESPANTRRQLWYSGSEARQAAAACSLQEETHGKAADDSSGSGSDGNSTTKRSLKRSNLSPPRGKRKSSGSDDIRVEGELVVSELHANDAKPTVRTLGLVSEFARTRSELRCS